MEYQRKFKQWSLSIYYCNVIFIHMSYYFINQIYFSFNVIFFRFPFVIFLQTNKIFVNNYIYMTSFMRHINWKFTNYVIWSKMITNIYPIHWISLQQILSGCSKYTHIKYDQYTGDAPISRCVSLNLKYSEFIMHSVTYLLFDASKAYYIRVDNY